MSVVSEPAEIAEFNYLPVGSKDPYPLYRQMREAGRLLRTPYGLLMVHRHEDVRRTHLDHDSFSMSALGLAAGGRRGGTGAMNGPGMMGAATTSEGRAGSEGSPEDGPGPDELMAQTMLVSDPPDHERLRRVVNRGFTPRAIAALDPRLRQLAGELLAPLAKGEPFDIVADFAAPFPTIVISELLGVPSEDAPQFRRWSEAVTGTNMRRPTDVATARQHGAELRRYLRRQVELRRREPTDDLIGKMVEANQSETMSDDEVVAACVLLLLAGNETTMRLISNMALALGRFPEQRHRLVEDPGLIPSGVEETLRYDSPIQLMFRAARKDTTIAGHEVARGQALLSMLGAANRDPDVFTEPDLYDVGRDDNVHVAFGYGIHFCLGSSLARLETAVAFEELLGLVPQYRLVTELEDLEYPASGLLRSPKSLVLRAG